MPDAAMTVALAVGDVRLVYHRAGQPHTALNHITLTVPAGQSVALLGPNGSGKSTLIRAVAGLLRPDSGSISVFGSEQLPEIRRRIGVVFQSPSLDPHLTVAENLRCQAALYGLTGPASRARIDEHLTRAALDDRRNWPVKRLSLGLARRVDLVRAALHAPDLLLLDEPTVGLDPTARERFLETIEAMRRETGVTILMSTHLTDEADRCDRVILMHRGEIVADDRPDRLRRALGGRILTVSAGRDEPPGVGEGWRRAAGRWLLPLPDDTSASSVLAASLLEAGVSFTVAPPTLADVFAQHTGAALESEEASGGENG